MSLCAVIIYDMANDKRDCEIFTSRKLAIKMVCYTLQYNLQLSKGNCREDQLLPADRDALSVEKKKATVALLTNGVYANSTHEYVLTEAVEIIGKQEVTEDSYVWAVENKNGEWKVFVFPKYDNMGGLMRKRIKLNAEQIEELQAIPLNDWSNVGGLGARFFHYQHGFTTDEDLQNLKNYMMA